MRKIDSIEFYEDYLLYEIIVEDAGDETERTYLIAAGNFDEAVAASKEFFGNRMQNPRLIITGVKELHNPILTFAVIDK